MKLVTAGRGQGQPEIGIGITKIHLSLRCMLRLRLAMKDLKELKKMIKIFKSCWLVLLNAYDILD